MMTSQTADDGLVVVSVAGGLGGYSSSGYHGGRGSKGRHFTVNHFLSGPGYPFWI